MVAERPEAPIARVIGKRQAILDQVQTGALPQPPDFSKPTHARFLAKLAQIVALAEAGDIAALQAFEINPVSSSSKAMARYRDLCVIAIAARAAGGRMKIELKAIEHHLSFSEETECHAAALWIDGVCIGRVSNHGTGGGDDFHGDHAAFAKADT